MPEAEVPLIIILLNVQGDSAGISELMDSTTYPRLSLTVKLLESESTGHVETY